MEVEQMFLFRHTDTDIDVFAVAGGRCKGKLIADDTQSTIKMTINRTHIIRMVYENILRANIAQNMTLLQVIDD